MEPYKALQRKVVHRDLGQEEFARGADLGQWEYRREEKEYITTPKSANDLFQG